MAAFCHRCRQPLLAEAEFCRAAAVRFWILTGFQLAVQKGLEVRVGIEPTAGQSTLTCYYKTSSLLFNVA